MPTGPAQRGRHPRRPHPRNPLLVALALLTVVVAVALPSTGAAFTATTTSASGTASAAAVFPSYPTQVGTAPRFWHRGDDAVSSTATPAAADSSGHSLPGAYDGSTDGPSTWWKLDETTGTAAADVSGAANPGVLTNGGATTAPGWTTGERVGAVSLDGADDAVVGARPAVDTGADFTVSAWVRLGGSSLPTTNVYAVSQNGTNQAAMALEFRQSQSGTTCNCWALRTTNSDAATLSSSQTDRARSTTTAVLGTWTHLLGVRSGTTLRLYVDGVDVSRRDDGSAGAQTITGSWSANGPLQVGRAMVNNGTYPAGGYFPGKVDEVKTWRRALTAAEVRDEYTGRLRGDWDFESVSSATNPATTPSGPTPSGTEAVAAPLTLHGTANSSTLSGGDHALQLTGAVTSYADRPATVDTTRSFTVSAWVNPTTLSSSGNNTIVSQDGSQMSGFLLQYYSATNRWGFTMYDSDVAGGGTTRRAESTTVPATNTWTHLTGVFDAEHREIRLYVGGTLESTVSRSASWSAGGNLVVGVGRSSGSATSPYNGLVDTVRVYQRAVAGDTAATDLMWTGDSDVTPTGFTAALPGALDGPEQNVTPNTAVAFAGSTSLANPQLYTAAQANTFTVECWIRVSAPADGLISTFANQTVGTNAATSTTGTGGSSDRMTYVDGGGRVTFVIKDTTGAFHTLRSPQVVNDGQWHHVATSLGAAGSKLYVDGVRVAQDTSATGGENFSGYWRFGGGRVVSRPNQPGSQYLTGTLDEMAVYPTQLTDLDVTHHFFADF